MLRHNSSCVSAGSAVATLMTLDVHLQAQMMLRHNSSCVPAGSDDATLTTLHVYLQAQMMLRYRLFMRTCRLR